MRVLGLACALFVFACGPSSKIGGDDGADAMVECAPNDSHRCVGSTFETCIGGSWVSVLDCSSGCVETIGCVDCMPGVKSCKDGNVFVCDANGEPNIPDEVCSGSSICVDGACVDACAEAAASKSYIGCEYWAVDLDNAVEILGAPPTPFQCNDPTFGYGAGVLGTRDVCSKTSGSTTTYAGLCDPPDNVCPTGYTCSSKSVCLLNAQQSPFAIVVSNPQAREAHVTVTGPGGQQITKAVAAGQVVPILPQMGNAIPDQSVDGTVQERRAYKVTSDLPIIAYQFNPLDNVDVFSNDASLLLPRTAFDVDYYAMSYPTLDRRTVTGTQVPQHNYYGYISIVAWQDNTVIEVTPKAAVQASATQSTIAAGTPTQFTLNAFDVLQLEAAPPDGDLTGTHITSPNMMTFGVFSGHEATNFGETTPPDASHTSGPCCADHLEEMMSPSTTWGKAFAIARSQKRTNEPDMLRIVAQKPGTMVTFTPPATGTCPMLNAGDFCQVKIAVDTEVSANEPILVGHYLEASMWRDNPLFGIPTWVGEGDPSMAIAVPSEQYRRDYTVLVPSQYAKSYLSISAGPTGGVSVDGQMVTLTPFPGGGTYRAARVMVNAGQHKITCADGCGITVYGYSDAVSYMFAGGLDLKPIVIL
jgi:hypothetical protein